jgi:UDP-N-acetylmuramyl tripeptide synthase
MMQLTHLMDTYPKVLDWAGDRVEVRGVVADLRQVQPGYLFVAIPGTGVNDCSMISEALKGGAADTMRRVALGRGKATKILVEGLVGGEDGCQT